MAKEKKDKGEQWGPMEFDGALSVGIQYGEKWASSSFSLFISSPILISAKRPQQRRRPPAGRQCDHIKMAG